MDNLWPIAFGLAIIGLIWAVVMTAKFNADRDDARRMNALDAAIQKAPNANEPNTLKIATAYNAFLEGHEPQKDVEGEETESGSGIYLAHEAG